MLRHFSKKEWLYATFSLFFIIIQVYLDLKLPDYMSQITTLVETEGTSISDVLIKGMYMLGCALGSMLCSMIVAYFAATVAASISKTLRANLFDKILDLSHEDIQRFSTASLINRTTNDITQVQTMISMGLQAIIKAPILAIWAIYKIYSKGFLWTMATAVAVFLLCIVLSVILIYAVPKFKIIQTLTDKINRISREYLTGVRVVRAYNAQNYQESKFYDANEELTNTNLFANRIMAIMSPSMTLINSGLTLAIYWIGACMIIAASTQEKLYIFSDMVVFVNYAMQVVMAFMLLNMIFILLPRASVSIKRINEVLNQSIKIKDGSFQDSTHKKGIVEFKDVSFQYPGSQHNAISNISFHIEQGKTLAIIGATGSGKTTLINLINRIYDATEGSVYVDEVNVKDYTLASLNNKIGYVSQKPILFSGTVASNVCYGDTAFNEKTCCDAIEISQAKDFVYEMENGIHSRISQSGQNVSGGQKQRLCIARAIAKHPEILIFDDSFSALDYKTEAELRKQLSLELKNVTKIIVAQRISTIRQADEIIVLDHGRIVGKGTHNELIKSCSVYKEIAASQLNKEELVYEESN